MTQQHHPRTEFASWLRTEAEVRRRNDDGISETLDEAAALIERMLAERVRLDRRIHKQRAANRDTWEIVEMRRKWLGSDTSRRLYIDLRKRYNKLRDTIGQSQPRSD